ncbi:antitoxin Xre/MbcA/ParS toxin-binding domain-containing protein [Orrella daihaiensis]|uniref:DUF2384 domain-containing protein n=1 Tax=Orrella daihaiensis TaxID=2782176 RepID=A0ABY4AMA8_9BURK|nr:DUF2384 domain-containing protein [Orrella daihaiensis]
MCKKKHSVADPATVLTKAVVRAADRLDVTRRQLACLLGLSQPTISRLYKGEYLLDQRRKEWELALLFIRVFRSLDAIVGQEQTARQWLQSPNAAFNSRPIDLIVTAEGLVNVAHYLDANRSIV